MNAYFDFFQDKTGEFKVAREIALKYKDFKISHFRKMFQKIEEQLTEIDEAANIVDEDQIDAIMS